MADSIRIDPQVLVEVGAQHDEVADHIAGARAAGVEIAAAVASYGPIMHQVKAAVTDLLAEREAALSDHESIHRSAAEALRTHAAGFAEQDAANADRLQF
ncbi:MAG: hypothetical protein JO152_06625 [Mycobacteriaceae bacterium]|nr:hypothetical protein [Mycobacteriaceae bacterium]